MQLLGKKVRHNTYGIGEIVDQTASLIIVQFPSANARFQYPNPDTFTKFLTAVDTDVQAAILEEARQEAELAAKIRAEEEARKKEEDERRAAEQQEADALARAALASRPRIASTKEYVKQIRTPGKRMVFFVFQGSTYDRESRGEYIWAPIANRAGLSFHHWDRLLDVRPGDIIFHGCNGLVQAVSTARGECYDCNQPAELRSEDMWEQEGRRVDCDYIPIPNPIRTSLVKDDIIRLCNVKYAPFDREGNGNMGYLFELNRELARIFLQETIKRNPQIGDIDFVRELLAEEDND